MPSAAVALATTSLAVFIIAMMGVEPTIGGPGPKPLLYVPDMNAGIAGVAALFLALAVVQGFRAYRAEATPRGTDE
jgi:hypothetical protein